jgi:two-component system response regulator HydG
VRELENAIEALVALSPGSGLDLDLLPTGVAADRPRAGLKERVEAFERGLISEALHKAGGNRSEAARVLGISRVTLHDKLRKYALGD